TVVNDVVTGVFRALHPSPAPPAGQVGMWSWTAITGFPASMGQPTALTISDQADTHLSLLADNNSADNLYMGFTTTYLDGVIWGAAIYQVTPSTNTWTPIVGAGANHTSPHADSRYMTFASYGFSNDILEADDGGIYRLHTYDQAARNWTSDFADLAITQ